MVFAVKGDTKRRIPDTTQFRETYKKLGYKIVESGGKKSDGQSVKEAKKEASTSKAPEKTE